MSRYTALPGFDATAATAYTPHALHGDSAVWTEKNCYADLWIELLHSLGMEPRAMLAFTLAVDFEGDQWTFFKPPLDELHQLYGVDVQEMTVWRPLIEHAVEQLGAGKLISTESDAYWLPDTAGTDYRSKHSKTTILLADLDVAAQRLGYFHNAGYFVLEGEDFRQLFRLDHAPDPAFLPLFAELVRIDRVVRRSPAELAAVALPMLRRHVARRPGDNPLRRFATRLNHELPGLRSAGLAHYHTWAFATIRQCGAAFDLASAHLRWLAELNPAMAVALRGSADDFELIAQGNKALILKVARSVNSGKPFDPQPLLDDMAGAWERGMARLGEALAA